MSTSGFADPYKPKHGETDLKLEIEGRGEVFIKLFTQEAPKASLQIIKLAKGGFYDKQRFHQVERTPKPYIIQIGDPDSKSGELREPGVYINGSGTSVPYENTGRQNVIGAVGLAHPMSDPNKGDSQFYIVLGTAKFLDGHYTVFGQVVSGMDVVQKVQLGDRLVSATIVTG
jgi:cyclophilin family peptidyl-prolyl cis-trans isomerase